MWTDLTLHCTGFFGHFVTSCIAQIQKIFLCFFWVRVTKGAHVTKLRWRLDTMKGSWESYEASKSVGGAENAPPPYKVGVIYKYLIFKYLTSKYLQFKYSTFNYLTFKYLTFKYLTFKYLNFNNLTFRYIQFNYVTFSVLSVNNLIFKSTSYLKYLIFNLKYLTF